MEPQASITDLDPVTRQAKVSIPSSVIDQEFGAALNRVAQSAKIKGFRPGKAPRAMVEKLHGPQVRWDVVTKMVSSSLENVLKKHELQMVGSPKIDIKSMEEGKDVEYTADFSIYPSPTITGYDSFDVRAPKAQVDDAAVEKVISEIRESKATIKPVEGRDAAQKGDVVNLQFSVSLDGGEFSAPEPATIGLGDGRLPEELESSLIGIKIGETRESTGAIPDTHQDPELRGKSAVYRVTLNAISEKLLPELDDALVATLAFEAKTVLELRLEVARRLEEQAERDGKEAAKNKIVDQLVERNQFDVPQELVDDEIRQLIARSGLVDPRKMDISQLPVEGLRENFGAMATKRVRTAIAVDRIAAQEKVSPTDEDLKAHVKNLAAQYNTTEDEVRKAFSNRQMAVQLAVEITRNRVLDLLFDRAKVTWISPDEAMKESETDTAEAAEGDAKPKRTRAKKDK